MKKKIIFVFLLVFVLLSSNIAITLAATKSELQNQQQEIQNQIDEAEEKQQEVGEKITEATKQIQELTAEINEYENQIEKLDEQLEGLEEDIEEAQEKLAEAEEKYDTQEEALKARIVAQYEAGETTYLDVILGGGSLWDMISNWQLVSDIAEKDNELLEQIEKNKNEIEEAKNTLETSKEQVETLKNSKEQTSKSLKNSQAVKEEQVSALNEEEKLLQEEIDKLNAENKEIERQLAAAEDKYSDKIANLGGNGTFQRPVKSGVITATMYYSSGTYHGALDYGIPIGTEVYAAEEGVVLTAGWSNGGYGNYVCLQHANGLRTYYAHGCGTFYVKQGDVVKRGQLIMLSGNSGRSTGPHLHFEVRVSPYHWYYGGGDSRRDPRNYL
ncbi:MAG: peptidoglycan DD-metalloendopeptidase family protein [Clostridia bacterium]|nr:peptidoglycan DD-metalloendopeptidase family protein [Clostridia bacterium]